MTKARLGSQSPKKSRKSVTFRGFTICEIVSPAPNRVPAKKELQSRRMINLRFRVA